MTIAEIKRFGGTNIIISTNVHLRNDGYPYANYGKLDDCGIAVYFTYEKNQVVFACDKWDKLEDNMQAIRKTIEAMRGLDRWGVSDMLNRAFTGFKALPEQTESSWWVILGISKDSTPEEIKKAYYAKAHDTHPDKNGGSSDEFQKVKSAYESAIS